MRRTNLDRESKHQLSYKTLPVDAVATRVPDMPSSEGRAIDDWTELPTDSTPAMVRQRSWQLGHVLGHEPVEQESLSTIPSATILGVQSRIRHNQETPIDPVVRAFNILQSQNVRRGFFHDLGNVNINRNGTVSVISERWRQDGRARTNRVNTTTNYNIEGANARQIGEPIIEQLDDVNPDAPRPGLLDRMFGRRR